MPDRLAWASALLAITIWGVGHSAVSTADEPKGGSVAEADEAVFPLQEVQVLGISSNPSLVSDLTRGARAETQEQPHEAVKAYPKLLSKKPIYGLIRLAPDPYQQESGTPFHFAADESGEKPAEETPAKEKEPEEESSILDTLSSALGIKKPAKPAANELPKLNNTYDRLYFDLNGDLDLTNDSVVTPMKETPPSLVRRYSSLRQAVVFDEITVPVDLGGELGSRPVRLLPRLEIQEYEGKEYSGVGFISAVVRKGSIKLGDQSYQAVLAQRYLITGRYDCQHTALLLSSSSDPNSREYWWGGDQLNAMRLVDGTYYTTSTTPAGDKLIVKPYRGPMGLLKIGPGDRDIDKLTIQGSLQSKETAVAVGQLNTDRGRGLEPASECRLPAGDYLPAYVTIEFGDLQLGISNNYHADGKPRGADHSKAIHGIQIREDTPFVWDFSTSPIVMFASPAKDQTYKPGDEISVSGVLVDPKLGIMIRRLTDTSRKEEKTVDMGSGRTTTYKESVSLDPVVTITNAAGKQIAEGPMPFG